MIRLLKPETNAAAKWLDDSARYEASLHFWGRLSLVVALFMFISYPLYVCIAWNAWPGWLPVFRGLLGVAPIYWVVGAIEALTFGPMLGAGGSYVGFVTGNLTAMKVPAALNALTITETEANTEDGDAVTTIAIAVCSLTTTLILFVGMLLLTTLTPILQSPLLEPAFANILPSLFGALAVIFIAKNWKLAVTPIIAMLLLFLFMPKLASAVSVLVPLSALLTVGAARFLYKRGLL